MDNKTKIYVITNCYGDPNKVYIGKTKNKSRNHKPKFGADIIYTEIDEVDSLQYKIWEPIETYWIEQFRQWGFEVMNIRKRGGSGPITHTEETKNIISYKTKGHIKSKEWKEKLSLSHKGRIYSKEAKEKMRISAKNRIYPENWGEKIKKGHKTKDKSFYKDPKWVKAQCKSIIQYDLDGNFLREFGSLKEASYLLNINYIGISHCVHKKQKTAYGYKWKFK
jgi:hypothetical protein